MVCNICLWNGLWCGIIKSLFFAFIIAKQSIFFLRLYSEGGSIAVGKASTDSVVSGSVLILFADLITKLLMG